MPHIVRTKYKTNGKTVFIERSDCLFWSAAGDCRLTGAECSYCPTEIFVPRYCPLREGKVEVRVVSVGNERWRKAESR
jgi:hypothetical protein